jgi:hypothetical protein
LCSLSWFTERQQQIRGKRGANQSEGSPEPGPPITKMIGFSLVVMLKALPGSGLFLEMDYSRSG